MKSFKHFRDEMVLKIRTKKSGLEHPVDSEYDKDEHIIGKELSGIKIPVEVHDEFDGSKGSHILKAKEGKYSLEKGEK